jgi:uncharacterized protein
VEISYDPAKRNLTWQNRGIDFEDAITVFDGLQMTQIDDRAEYGEVRYQTFGLLNDRLVVIVWISTERGRRIISMRKCNGREQVRYRHQLG